MSLTHKCVIFCCGDHDGSDCNSVMPLALQAAKKNIITIMIFLKYTDGHGNKYTIKFNSYKSYSDEALLLDVLFGRMVLDGMGVDGKCGRRWCTLIVHISYRVK